MQSSDPLIIRSRLNCKHVTEFKCPWSVVKHAPVSRLHTWIKMKWDNYYFGDQQLKLIPVKHRKWCTANFSSLQTKKQPFRILTKVNKRSMGLVGAAKLNWDKFVKRMIKSAFLRYHNFQNITFDVYRKCITNDKMFWLNKSSKKCQ